MSAKVICVISGVTVTQNESGEVYFKSSAAIDADGANGQSGVWAYRPGNTGVEHLANAGYPDHPEWYKDILVCGFDGKPITIHGGYISKTAYEWTGEKDLQKRYVDAATVPYVVVSPTIRNKSKDVVLGCKAIIRNTKTGQSVEAVVADIGPRHKIGELSIAAATNIGINPNPRMGGTDDKIIEYLLFPGTPAVVNGITYDLKPA